MSSLGGLVSVGKAFVAANRPEILFGTSVVSTLGAVVMAARGGYKSGIQVAEAEVESVLRKLPAEACVAYEREVNNPEHKLGTKQIAKLTWINYLPAAGATLGAVGSTTGLHLVHVQEKKQLAAAALIAIDQVRKEGDELKKEITNSLGVAVSEEQKDLDKAAKKSGVAKVVNRSGQIEEMFLVRDRKTGRDIFSNRLRIEDAMNLVNRQLARGESVDLNTFYGYAGFESIPEGNDLGWNAGVDVEIAWIKESDIRDDGRPSRPFRFNPEPEDNYDPNH